MALFDKYQILLAPMAGVTDAPFRQLCIAAGADLAFTEMVSAKGLAYANDKTRKLIDVASNEKEISVQIFGHEPKIMAEQAKWIEEALGDNLAYIDINMGCPARKIVSKGDGSALMKTPELAAKIVEAIKNNVAGKVTCKIRRGWSAETGESAPAFAKTIENAGADAITVHGRYSTQMYRGKSCLDSIAKVKDAVNIPVVGNGDITSSQDAINMLKKTNVDAIMIGRAAQGNPWIFTEVKAALKGDEIPASPDIKKRTSIALQHAKMLEDLYGRDIRSFRKHAMWYVYGLPGASTARGEFNQCSTFNDFKLVFEKIVNYAS